MASKCKTAILTCTILVFLCLLSACTRVVVQHPFDVSADSQDSDNYQLGPEDVLEVIVWKKPDLSKVVTVRPDGKISLPLIGDIPATGFTSAQVKDDIAERLREFYKESP